MRTLTLFPPPISPTQAAEALLRPLPPPGSTDREPQSPAELAAAAAWQARHEAAVAAAAAVKALPQHRDARVPPGPARRRATDGAGGGRANVPGYAPRTSPLAPPPPPCWRPAPTQPGAADVANSTGTDSGDGSSSSSSPAGWPACGPPPPPVTHPGHDHAAEPAYFADGSRGAPPPGYVQWLRVTVAGDATAASPDPASAPPVGWPAPVPAAAAAPPRLTVGWDVGGAVTVDAASVLFAAWDARLPPELLLRRRVAAASNADPLASDSSKVQAAMQLQVRISAGGGGVRVRPGARRRPLLYSHGPRGLPPGPQSYGLTAPGEASAFVACLHAWQLLIEGRIAPDAVPPACLLRHSAPASGVSRWVFGSLGTQPPPLDGAAPSPLGAPVGSPDLLRSPLVTRFEDCARVGLAAAAGQVEGGGSGGNLSGGTVAGACGGSQAGMPLHPPALSDVVVVQVKGGEKWCKMAS